MRKRFARGGVRGYTGSIFNAQNMLKRIAQVLLKIAAKLVLLRRRPVVIGITGSVGKTTAKDAIAFAVSKRFSVFASAKNYNNEIGLPLAILGESDEPGRSVLVWMKVFLGAGRKIFLPFPYPEVLVLEMGVDRPGDMAYLLSIAKPDIAVVTGVSQSHIEFFGSEAAIAEEKGRLVEALGEDGVAILNADNVYSRGMKNRTKAKVILYGFSKRASLRGFNDSVAFGEAFRGLTFKVEYQENIIPVRLKHTVARHHIEAVLAALGVCDALEIPFLEAAQALANLRPSPGRFRLLEGVRGALIADDTYNASPASVRAAIASLRDVAKGKTVAILGDMLELGEEERALHEDLAADILKAKVSFVILAGERMRYLFDRLTKEGFRQNQLFFAASPSEASAIAKRILAPGMLVLVKGSQAMRMEKVVERLLAYPERDAKHLCRQSPEWKAKPFRKP